MLFIKKNLLLICIAVVSFAAVIVLVCVGGVARYVLNVPKITPKFMTVNLEAGETVRYDELADFKCVGGYDVSLSIIDTNIPTAKISDDKESVYVGDSRGYIHLNVTETGDHSEGRSEDLYIFVSMNQEEAERFVNVSDELKSKLDTYLHEEFFTEKNNTEEGRYYLMVMSKDSEGFKILENTEELFSKYIEKFDGATMEECIVSYQDYPYDNDIYNSSLTYYLAYKTKSGEMIHMDAGVTFDNECIENGDTPEIDSVSVKIETPDDADNYMTDVLKMIFENASDSATVSEIAARNIVPLNTWVNDRMCMSHDFEEFEQNGKYDKISSEDMDLMLRYNYVAYYIQYQ